ncbi:PEP-CTERM sorting domain-containing protein [Pannus brasiliensis CCIBt3594]|uniref:PEP-CTERM sorting domain-containing protein n=1 Tax=Pannus brasiliensis CCIBt3594 TaxID=1427578 RepID=A0AAW9QWJ5_9CHRO
MKRILSTIAMAGILGIGIGFAPQANAFDLVGTFPGNDCAGAFGIPPNCNPANAGEDFAEYDSPLIVKFDFGLVDGKFGITETTWGVFGPLTGLFEFDFNVPSDDNNTGTGTWYYTPSEGDPLIKSYAVKGGPEGFNFFSSHLEKDALGRYFGEFFTPNTPSGTPAGLSHISFYDTAVQDVPEPSLLLGLGAVVGGGVFLRRRKSS